MGVTKQLNKGLHGHAQGSNPTFKTHTHTHTPLKNKNPTQQAKQLLIKNLMLHRLHIGFFKFHYANITTKENQAFGGFSKGLLCQSLHLILVIESLEEKRRGILSSPLVRVRILTERKDDGVDGHLHNGKEKSSYNISKAPAYLHQKQRDSITSLMRYYQRCPNVI